MRINIKENNLSFLSKLFMEGILSRSLIKRQFKKLFSVFRKYGVRTFKVSNDTSVLDVLGERGKMSLRKYSKLKPLFRCERHKATDEVGLVVSF